MTYYMIYDFLNGLRDVHHFAPYSVPPTKEQLIEVHTNDFLFAIDFR